MASVVRRGPREIVSSVALQKLIYFNTFYSIAWWLTTITILLRKYMKGLSMKDPDEVRTIFMVFFMVFEPARLIIGYYGNLQEKAPFLIMLVLITFVPVMPACLFMIMGQEHMTPYQRALQIPQLLFLLATLGFGIRALVRVYRYALKQQPYILADVTKQSDRVDRPVETFGHTPPKEPDAKLAPAVTHLDQGSAPILAGGLEASGYLGGTQDGDVSPSAADALVQGELADHTALHGHVTHNLGGDADSTVLTQPPPL